MPGNPLLEAIHRLDAAVARAEQAVASRDDAPPDSAAKPQDAVIRQALGELDALIAQIKEEEDAHG